MEEFNAVRSLVHFGIIFNIMGILQILSNCWFMVRHNRSYRWAMQNDPTAVMTERAIIDKKPEKYTRISPSFIWASGAGIVFILGTTIALFFAMPKIT
jgi:hypothetical protein